MEELKKCLKPFTDILMMAKTENNPSFDLAVESLKSKLIELNICKIKSNPFLLDKIFDEILEE